MKSNLISTSNSSAVFPQLIVGLIFSPESLLKYITRDATGTGWFKSWIYQSFKWHISNNAKERWQDLSAEALCKLSGKEKSLC